MSTSLAEINVVPLVDVMLVLLIIFMVAAPMLQRGVEVNLPVASRSQEIASDRIFVNVPLSFREDRRVFIGLFGTVVGIMIAFQRIGATGSTNLAVVAPGISEALIATAAGLFAAIPAVYFYNSLTNRVKHFAQAMDDFSLEFINLAERNFT